jgi:UDP-4-amino-4,6-dideoxy-N-acetyl-beta-L-altrosamine transaminase
LKLIPYGRQNISQEDIDSVIDVLRSDFLTQGPKVPEFEKSLVNYCKSSYAIALNSATSALHISCLTLGLGKGDWLWTSANTFPASANCAIYCGAKVDFIDINPNTYNLCTNELEKKLIEAEKNGTLPKIVVAVHFAGQSCDMAKIYALSKKYNFNIIEDASHAIGGKYNNKLIGSCLYSDITVFSFHPVKIITSGEGGMALTNDKVLAEKIELLRSHGITRDANKMVGVPDGPWFYQQIDLGFNYRMTDIQATLGISQMNKIDEFVAIRHDIAMKYDESLNGLPLILPMQEKFNYSSFHLYPIKINLDKIGKSLSDVFESMRNSGIGVNKHYIPVYRHPFFANLGFREDYCQEAKRYYEQSISLPIFPGLNLKQQTKVIDSLKKAISL